MKNNLNGVDNTKTVGSFNELDKLLKDKKMKPVFERDGLTFFKKSRFYMNKGVLREHIATYKGYAILLDHNNLKETLDENKTKMMPILISANDIKLLKKINGNIIRKLNPQTLTKLEKAVMLDEVMKNIDSM